MPKFLLINPTYSFGEEGSALSRIDLLVLDGSTYVLVSELFSVPFDIKPGSAVETRISNIDLIGAEEYSTSRAELIIEDCLREESTVVIVHGSAASFFTGSHKNIIDTEACLSEISPELERYDLPYLFYALSLDKTPKEELDPYATGDGSPQAADLNTMKQIIRYLTKVKSRKIGDLIGMTLAKN